MSDWISHFATALGRPVPGDTPIEARLRDDGVVRNRAGNLDNWRWRETGPGSVEAYREIPEAELPRWLQSSRTTDGDEP